MAMNKKKFILEVELVVTFSNPVALKEAVRDAKRDLWAGASSSVGYHYETRKVRLQPQHGSKA